MVWDFFIATSVPLGHALTENFKIQQGRTKKGKCGNQNDSAMPWILCIVAILVSPESTSSYSSKYNFLISFYF